MAQNLGPAGPGAGRPKEEVPVLEQVHGPDQDQDPSGLLHLLHHLHQDGPGPRQDQVADSPVVLGQHVEPVDRHHKLTHLHTGEGGDRFTPT